MREEKEKRWPLRRGARTSLADSLPVRGVAENDAIVREGVERKGLRDDLDGLEGFEHMCDDGRMIVECLARGVEEEAVTHAVDIRP